MVNLDKIHNILQSYYMKNDNYFIKMSKRENGVYRGFLQIITGLNKKESKILDVGCGPGIFLNILNSQGYNNIEGIDISRITTEYHKDIIVSDFLKYPFSKQYDIITCSDYLEHVVYVEKHIFKMCNLLTENGLLMIQLPNFIGPLCRMKKYSLRAHLKFFKYLLNSYIGKDSIQYIEPKLDNNSFLYDDSDACSIIGPHKIINLIKSRGLSIGYYTTFYNQRREYGKIQKTLLKFLQKMPFIKDMGGSIFVIAHKGKFEKNIIKNIL